MLTRGVIFSAKVRRDDCNPFVQACECIEPNGIHGRRSEDCTKKVEDTLKKL